MSAVGGLRGWQWLFLFEALPSVIAGLLAMIFLADGPAKAGWLNAAERELLTRRLEEEHSFKMQTHGHHKLIDAFRSRKVWLLCAVYFGFVMGNYAVGFWLPQIVKETLTKDPWLIGWLTAIPWAAAAIAMVIVGHHSDATGERRWHIALSGIAGGLAFAASAVPGISGSLGLFALTIATAGIACAYSTFWALPTGLLSGTAASAGIAWINSVGNLAGYVSPYVVGKIRDVTHSMTPALLLLSLCCLASALITIVAFRHRPASLTTDSLERRGGENVEHVS
jgi:nitrate/nitrite transporter NarK